MSDYQNFDFRLLDIGLNLRDVNDRVGEGQWTVLKNVRSTQEARVQTREGRSEEVTIGGGPVHSLRRVSTTLLSGIGTTLYRSAVVLDTGYSGNPLSIIPFRQELSPNVWGFIGDSSRMRMVKADGTSYQWGITAPTSAASFAASSGAGPLDSSVGVSYNWKYTYKSSTTGARSNGSPAGTAIAVVNKNGEVTVQASSDAQVDQIELWRTGGTLAEYHLSKVVPNVGGLLSDDQSDLTISTNETLPEDNFVPFTSEDSSGNPLYGVPIPRLWGPFLGRVIFGCGDTNRKGAVYYTNEGRPHSADDDNFVEVTGPQEPLQHGFLYGGNPYVFSQENVYALMYGSALTLSFSPILTPVGKGLMAPYAFCVGPAVFFLSKDGIYATDCQGPAQSITEETMRPIFQKVSIGDYKAVDFTAQNDLRMSFHGQVLHFFYKDTDGAYQHLTYNVAYKRWKNETSSLSQERMGYSDEMGGSFVHFLGMTNGNVYEVDRDATTDAGTAISVQARTGSMDAGMPQTFKEWGNLIIDADPKGATLTITPYLDAETSSLTPQTITGTGRQKFTISLSDTYAYSIAFDFAWSGPAEIYGITIQWRPDEEAVKHWEFPETSHQITGVLQVKDVYLCLRSSVSSTLTVKSVLDGVVVTKTYPVASTSGRRAKLLVPLEATKGQLYSYALDSSSSAFRLYGEDCEVRVKPWKTNEGYQLVTPFA